MSVNRPVAPTAAAHAERIRARAEERAATAEEPDGRPTWERYADRALAGARADEALRQEARKNELRARGLWVPGDEPEADEEEEFEEPEEEVEEADEEAEPKTTAEVYAARERARQRAEHGAILKAHQGSTWATVQQARRIW